MIFFLTSIKGFSLVGVKSNYGPFAQLLMAIGCHFSTHAWFCTRFEGHFLKMYMLHISTVNRFIMLYQPSTYVRIDIRRSKKVRVLNIYCEYIFMYIYVYDTLNGD